LTPCDAPSPPPPLCPPPLAQDSPSQEQLEQALQEAAANAQQGGKQGKEIKITLESAEGGQEKRVEADPEMAKAMQEAAEQIVRKWEQEMEEVRAGVGGGGVRAGALAAGRWGVRRGAGVGDQRP
jgi:flagellar biosynthesis/type III secretory pathway protein FliH